MIDLKATQISICKAAINGKSQGNLDFLLHLHIIIMYILYFLVYKSHYCIYCTHKFEGISKYKSY